MGSESTPDTPALRIACQLHDLDATLGALDDAHRAGLLAAVTAWLAYHTPEERTPQWTPPNPRP